VRAVLLALALKINHIVYEKEEYYRELDRIKTTLIQHGEYGEFLPYRFSTFAYNGSAAIETFELSEKEAKAIGALWQPPIESDIAGLGVIDPAQVPESIAETDDSILTKAIVCKITGKPFRILPTELAFCRSYNIPVPVIHPSQRIKDRFPYMGNHRVNNTVCASCKKEIGSMYDPKAGWVLYCDECYQRDFI
jgi:hypothetical protein